MIAINEKEELNGFLHFQIDELTKETILEEKIFLKVLYIEDEAEKIRLLTKLKEKAKDLKVLTPFNEMLRLYQKKTNKLIRQDATAKEHFNARAYFEGEKFLHHLFGDYLINTYNILKIDQQLYFYYDGYYIPCKNFLGNLIVELLPFLSAQKKREVKEYVHDKAEEVKESHERYICLANGILDMKTLTLEEHTPKIITRNKIEFDYKEQFFNDDIDTIMSNLACGDDQVVTLLYEMIGYCLYRGMPFQKFFMLYGNGKNGKTTLFEMITYLLGEDNVSTIDLKDIVTNKFASAGLYGKLANIADDCSGTYLEDVSILKRLSGGGRISIEYKGKDSFSVRINTKIILSYNTIPRMNDTTDGLGRRIVIIPLNAVFDKTKPTYDPFIKDKLKKKENIEYILFKSIQAMYGVLERQEFTLPKSVEIETEEYLRGNNPLKTFIYDTYPDGNVEHLTTDELRRAFDNWVYDNGYKTKFNSVTFGVEMKKLGYIKKQKHGGRRYYSKTWFLEEEKGEADESGIKFEQDQLDLPF